MGVATTPVGTGAIWHEVQKIAASRIHDVLNGFALTNALFCFVESKLLADLRRDGVLIAAEAAARHKYDPFHTLGLLRYLMTQDVLKEDPGERFRLSPIGEAMLSLGSRGFLRLYRGGYGHLMMQAGELLDGSLVYGRDVTRDGHFVALGANESTSAVVNAVPLSVMEQMGVRTIADLGCGAGAFLIEFCQRSSAHRAIGVDIDPEGVEAAKVAVAQAGLSDRIKLVQGNAFDLTGLQKECAEAELFVAFAIEHELLRDGEAAVLAHIDRLAELFPKARGYLLGEPLIRMTREDGAFYWFHTLSRQGIPRDIEGWSKLLSRLTRARLENVYVPDYGQPIAYFDIRF